MGGSESKQITRTEVTNEINVTIENETQNLTKIFNETVNSSSASVVNSIASTIKINTSAGNTAKMGNLVASGPGSSIDIEQNATVVAQNSAIMQIIQDSSQLAKMASQIGSDLTNATQNNSAAKASMDTLNTLKQSTTDGGGIEGMVNAAMKAISDLGGALTGAKSTSEATTMIKNQMSTNIKNKTTNSSDITNKIKNSTDTMVKNITENTCNFDTNATNNLDIANAIATGGASIKVAQRVSITAFNSCVISAMNTSKLVSDLTGVQSNKVGNTTTNTNKAESDLKAKNEVDQSKKSVSALTDAFTALTSTGMYLMVGGVVLVIIIAAIFLLMGGGDELVKMKEAMD